MWIDQGKDLHGWGYARAGRDSSGCDLSGEYLCSNLVCGTGKWSILAGKELVLFSNGTVSTILNNKIIPLFSRLHKRNGVLYFCSDENRNVMNEFTVVQHLIVWIDLFGTKANSDAIPQACAHTHTCMYMGHYKIDSTRPVCHDSILSCTSSICAGCADYKGWGSSTCTNISIVYLSSIVTKSYCLQGFNLLAWTVTVDFSPCLWRLSEMRSYKFDPICTFVQ